MLKWLLLMALGWVAWRMLFRQSSGRVERDSSIAMARCSQCGLVFPESEAVSEEGNRFCCEGHRLQWRKSR